MADKAADPPSKEMKAKISINAVVVQVVVYWYISNNKIFYSICLECSTAFLIFVSTISQIANYCSTWWCSVDWVFSLSCLRLEGNFVMAFEMRCQSIIVDTFFVPFIAIICNILMNSLIMIKKSFLFAKCFITLITCMFEAFINRLVMKFQTTF